MNIMRIQEIRRVGQNRLEYSYAVEGAWKSYFDLTQPMWAEYNTCVENVPDSIAVLPLIGNFIVLASLMDAEIYVDEIDRDFYECIEEFIQGFDTIMPEHVHFKHRDIVHANKIVENPLCETEQAENLLFFSGGVDATFSLVAHMAEKPALVTIWGADIPWDQEETWNRAITFNQEVANRHGLNLLTIRSNLRRSLHDANINDYSYQLVGNWWWPAFHHGIAMMCLAAPLTHGKRKHLYLASSFTEKELEDWVAIATASAPQIDNYVRFCGCQVVHDGSSFSRYDKIRRICEYYEQQTEQPYLRVCYHSHTGKNCGVCEKCVRDIMTIQLLGYNPEEYGFPHQEETLPQLFAAGLQEMARTEKNAFISFYKDIQAALRQKYSIQEVHPVLRAFYETDLKLLADFLHVPNNEYLSTVHRSKETQEELYRQIGQLRYQLETIQRSGECAPIYEATALAQANEQIRTLEEQLQKLYQSTSWKMTKPLRSIGKILKRGKV